jgi:hypothetical protein
MKIYYKRFVHVIGMFGSSASSSPAKISGRMHFLAMVLHKRSETFLSQIGSSTSKVFLD